MTDKLKLAMDKSLRSVDKFGKMRVEMSNISKAAVNPYYGREIPNGDALGLEPDKIYMLLRDPEELRRAAPTFNNLPILDRHIPVTAEKPSREYVVGSTGTDAQFDEPFMRNSLVIWDATAIAGINLNVQRELSSAYSYIADMTPGVYNGVSYDGVMRDIVGNHVALVESGRAGPDVIVGDSKLLENPKMKKLSANATAVKAALMGYLTPLIAQDAQIGDLAAIAGSVKDLKSAKNQATIVTKVTAAFGDKLAQDANLDKLPALLATLAQDEADEPDDKKKVAEDEDEPDDKKKVAEDADEPDDKSDSVDKPAMDAAIKSAVAKATADTMARMTAIRQAEHEVEPVIGKLAIAQDSAPAVYKLALDAAKVDLTDVPQSAYRAVFLATKTAAATAAPTTRMTIAQDSASGAKSFADRFPNAGKMKGGV